MNINHNPITKLDKAISFFEEKEGCKVKYVLTTEHPEGMVDHVYDIFYRDSPHPEFKNHYFGIDGENIMNGDWIEEETIGMIKSNDGDSWMYSQSNHDYVSTKNGVIDGGRQYIRGNNFKTFRIKNGNFIENNSTD